MEFHDLRRRNDQGVRRISTFDTPEIRGTRTTPRTSEPLGTAEVFV